MIWYATQCDGVHTKVKFKVTKRSKTTFLRSESNGRNLLKLSGMIGHDPKNYRLIFGSDWVRGQGQGHFYDISPNLYPICTKPAPKCAEFNSQLYGMPHNLVMCMQRSSSRLLKGQTQHFCAQKVIDGIY